MTQSNGESPSEFLSRLYEGADLANISDEKFIFSKFKTGLLIDIKVFCKEMYALNFQEWIKHSNAWWNAHSVKTIHLVDNPFNSANISNPNGNNGKNLNLKTVNSEEMAPSKDVFIKPNPKLAKEAYASPMSPSIANLTAKMEALELHSLIPNTGEKGQIDSSVIRGNAIKSLIADKEFKSFIKNIIQETYDEKVTPYKPYKNTKQRKDNYSYQFDTNYYPEQDYYPDRYYQDRRGQDR
ncbi:hypothetical protein, partial, partial [Parasitella parasitica]